MCVHSPIPLKYGTTGTYDITFSTEFKAKMSCARVTCTIFSFVLCKALSQKPSTLCPSNFYL